MGLRLIFALMQQMIESFYDKSTSRPHAGPITKLVRYLEIVIPISEFIQHPLGFFGKATVQKFQTQLSLPNQDEAQEEPAPAAGGDPGASSSSSSVHIIFLFCLHVCSHGASHRPHSDDV